MNTHLHLCLAGKNPTDEYLEGMMSEAPGPINFTMFLTMFGEKLNGTDPEDVIRNAFACFDEEASGQVLPALPFGQPGRGLGQILGDSPQAAPEQDSWPGVPLGETGKVLPLSPPVLSPANATPPCPHRLHS